MTLKEKFSPHVKYWDCYNDEPLKYDHNNKCVKIADEFAIGFADWFHANCYEDKIGYYTASELLETYKKEKGL